MQHIEPGQLDVSRIGMGAMPIKALCTGANTEDEELLGKALKGRRDGMVPASSSASCRTRAPGGRARQRPPDGVFPVVPGAGAGDPAGDA
ncbi:MULTISPECIES: hypothetical protein [unclassified Streptomyces]|uniref:hypothetical protein n=1 Tax=unclassified Streptomyces TaxID=2593676 RepID=UPI0033EF5C66